MTEDLVTWLRAQLAEDELVAQAAAAFEAGASWAEGRHQEIPGVAVASSGSQAEHIARHDPARVLAEVDAKRRILDELAPHVGNRPRYGYLLRLLALPYADRPGYRDEWKP